MTTTDIEVLPPASSLAPLAANPTQSRQQQLDNLRAEAEFLDVAMGLAERACSNGGQLVAQHFRNKPADGAIAIAYGSSLGWHWTKSLQDVYVVNGKPSIQSKEIRELLIRAGHEIWEEVVGPDRVVLAGRRRGSELVVRVEWTMEKAKQADLLKNPNYNKFPENMLYARCTTDLGKRLAPDAMSGLGVVEELQDMGYADKPVRVQSERPRGVDALRERAAQAQQDGATEKSAGDMTPATRKKWQNRMFALLAEGECTARDDQLIVMTALAGRADAEQPEHRDGLDDDELRTVVNALNAASKEQRLGAVITDLLNAYVDRQAADDNQDGA